MYVDITARLNELKAKTEQAKTEKTRADATLEQLNTQKKQVETELAALNVTPEGLDAEIVRLESEINDSITQAEQLLTAPIPVQGVA